jgi:peptide/nickel transport system substrate-binding protein
LDLAKAEEILTGIGFTRDSDGVWMDETGKRLEFELSAPAEFADWSAAAENLAQQLTDFGIKTSFRGVNFHAARHRRAGWQIPVGYSSLGSRQPTSFVLLQLEPAGAI